MRSQETTQGLIRWTISQDRYDCCCILLSVPRPHSNNSKYWMIRPDHHLQLHLLKDWSHEMSPPTPFHILLHFYLLLLFRFVDMGTSLPPHSPRWLQSYSFGSLVYWCNMFTHIHLLTTIPNDISSSVTPVTAMRYRSIGFSPPFCCWIIQTLRWMYCCSHDEVGKCAYWPICKKNRQSAKRIVVTVVDSKDLCRTNGINGTETSPSEKQLQQQIRLHTTKPPSRT